MVGHGAADGLRGLGGAGEGHAADPCIRSQRRAHRTGAGQQLQGGAGHAGLMQQAHGEGGDKRGLLGRFGQHGIARGQCGGDLAGEDGKREVPRRNAGKGADGCGFGRIGAVVTQEIHGLAQFGHGVGQGLACLAGQEGKDLAEMRLIEIRRA